MSEDQLRLFIGKKETELVRMKSATTNHPPYKRKDELVQKKVILHATYDKIEDQIVGRQK